MHIHQSLFRGGENVMYDFNGYGLLSREALNYIGGLLEHGRALMAFCAPTTNSYRRLVPGYEAPVNLAYSQRNRSAACRIPVYSAAEKAKRVEFRPPDPTANPYLACSAMLMAGLDGIQQRIDPGLPVDKDLFELPEEELAQIGKVPGSLDEAIDALEADHEFLLKGGVFTEDLIETWIDYKRREECDPVRIRPHPWEFALYYDI
jgi:glutamine synthetase